MTRRRRVVRAHAEFDADFAARVEWLEERGELLWLERLKRELEEVRDLLATFPALGRVLEKGDGPELRWLPLPKAPYVVWYLVDADSGDVWLFRVFHARQDRPLRPKKRRH